MRKSNKDYTSQEKTGEGERGMGRGGDTRRAGEEGGMKCSTDFEHGCVRPEEASKRKRKRMK